MADTVVTSDGTRLHVEVDGPATAPLTVIFAHGLADTLVTWRPQREALSGVPVRRVFYDHRAFGRSQSGPGVPPSIDQLAADLCEVIGATAGDGTVVLVGHSMGGLTVQALSAIAPELFGTRVVASVLMAHPIRGDLLTAGLPRWAAAQLRARGPAALARIARPDIWPRAVLACAAKRACAPGTAAAVWSPLVGRIRANLQAVQAGYLGACFRCDHTATLSVLGNARAVVVLGERDRLVPPSSTRAVARALPGAEQVSIEHSGHMVHLEAPDLVNAVLDDVITTALQDTGPRSSERSAR